MKTPYQKHTSPAPCTLATFPSRPAICLYANQRGPGDWGIEGSPVLQAPSSRLGFFLLEATDRLSAARSRIMLAPSLGCYRTPQQPLPSQSE